MNMFVRRLSLGVASVVAFAAGPAQAAPYFRYHMHAGDLAPRPPAPTWNVPTVLPEGLTGSFYVASIPTATSSDGSALTYKAVSLPPGLTFDPYSLTISGTPSASGAVAFSLSVSDDSGTASQVFTASISGAPNWGSFLSSYTGTVNTPFSVTIPAAYSDAGLPVTYAATSLPEGFTFDPSTRQVSGTPDSTATRNFTFTATNANGSVSRTMLLYTSKAQISLSYGDSISHIVVASDGTGSGTGGSWTSTSGSGGGGTGGSGTGGMGGNGGGTGSGGGAGGMGGGSGGSSYAGGASPNIMPLNPNSGLTYWYKVSSGSLPPGMTLDTTTGQLSGTPTSYGTYTFTIQMTDQDGNTAVANQQISVTPPPILTYNAMSVTVGQGAQFYPSTKGNLIGAVNFELSSAPDGFVLGGNGTVIYNGSSTTSAGTYTLSVKATDNAGSSITTLVPVTVTGSLDYALPSKMSTVQAFTSVAPTLLGQTASSWRVGAGALPPGIQINPSNGALTGQPTAIGNYSFSLAAVSDAGLVATSPVYSVNVVSTPVVSLAYPVAIQNAVYGKSLATYQYAPSLMGVSNPNYSVSGSYPYPYFGSSSLYQGYVGGTVSVPAGTYNYEITASDPKTGVSATASLTTVVTGTLAYSLPSTLSTQQPYTSNAPSLVGMTASSWSVSSGALPPGMSVDQSTGKLTGQATGLGSYNFAITAIGSSGQTATSPTYSMTVQEAPVVSLSYPSGVQNAVYRASLSYTAYAPAVSGLSNLSYSWSGSTPFPYLTYNTAYPGYIGGTVNSSAGTYTFTVTAIDRLTNAQITIPITTVVTGTLAYYLPSTLSTRQPYTSNAPSLAGMTAASWSVSSGALPPGITLDQSTGKLTGQATNAGSYSFTITATGSSGQTATSPTYSVTVQEAQAVSLTYPSGVQNAVYGASLSYTAYAPIVTGLSSIQYSWAGQVPYQYLSYNSSYNGYIGGSVIAPAGTYNFTVTATDAYTNAQITVPLTTVVTGTLSYSLPTTLSTQQSYTSNAPSLGGMSATSWSVSSGALPPGMSVDQSTGKLTGLATSTGTYSFSIMAAGSAGQTATSPTYTVTVQDAPSVTLSYPTGIQNAVYGASLSSVVYAPSIRGLTRPSYSWAGQVPYQYLSYNSSYNGYIGGSVIVPAGTYNFTVTATDAYTNAQITVPITTVVTGTLAYSLPKTFSTRQSYTSNAPTLNGLSATSWSVSSGALPPGMSVDQSTGKMTGLATSTGTYSFAIIATGSSGQTATSPTYTVTVQDAPSVTLSYPSAIQNAVYGASLSSVVYAPSVTGMTNVVYSWLGNSPFPYLSYNSLYLGYIGGSVSVPAGTYNFQVTARDTSTNAQITVPITTVVTGTLAYSLPTTLSTQQSYTSNAPSLGGLSANSWSVSSGALPPGMSVDQSTGKFTGQPTSTGSYSFAITATGSAGQTATSPTYSVTVRDTPAFTLSYPSGIQNAVYGASIGNAAYAPTVTGLSHVVYSLSGSSPFPYLTVNSNYPGYIGGSVSVPAGTYNFQVTAKDTTTNAQITTPITTVVTGTLSYSLPSTLSTQQSYTSNAPNLMAMSATSWSVSSGALPPGMSVDQSTGKFTGKPTSTGTFSFSITATGSAGQTATSPTYTVTVQDAPAVTLSYPSGIQNAVYGASLGNAAYAPTLTGLSHVVYSLSGSSPFPYLTVNSYYPGYIGGSVSVPAGTYNFQVTAKDTTTNAQITVPITTVVTGILKYTYPESIPVNQSYTSSAPSLWAMTAKSWQVATGALPPGMIIDQSTGKLTGQPTSKGIYNFTITAIGSSGQTATSNAITITILG